MANSTGSIKQAKKREIEEKYRVLCESGCEYSDILEELSISRAALTKYALDTEVIPSVADYEPRQLYQLLYEFNVSKHKTRQKAKQKEEQAKAKERRTYDPDLWLM